MHQVAACSRIGAVPACCRSQLLRPVQHHGRHIPFQPAVVRRSLQSSRKRECTCSAGDQDSKLQTNSEDDVRPEISKTKLADKGADTEVPKLGLAGTIATWALLIVSTVKLFSLLADCADYCTAKRVVYSATLGVFAVSVRRFLVFHIFTVIPARYATTGCKQSRNRLQLLDTTSSHSKGFGEVFVLSVCRFLEHCRADADKIAASIYSYSAFSRKVQCSVFFWALIFGGPKKPAFLYAALLTSMVSPVRNSCTNNTLSKAEFAVPNECYCNESWSSSSSSLDQKSQVVCAQLS